MNVFINYSTLAVFCATSNEGQKYAKTTRPTFKAMQVNLYELYTTYLVNIFATLNNLNSKGRSAIIISLLFIAAAMSLKLH